MSAAHDDERAHPWWSSGNDAGAAAGDGSDGPPAGTADERADRAGAEHAHGATIEACQVCPICSLLRVVGQTRPDLVHHIAEATRHLTLAAKAIIDAQAGGWAKGGLQHIPLDDE